MIMTDNREVLPRAQCKTCDRDVAYPGADACSVCWAIESHLNEYITSPAGRAHAVAALGLDPVNDVTALRERRQATVANWCVDAFGSGSASSVTQRGLRMLEEAIEAYQAAGCDRAMAHKLVDYVFDRPVGELFQELGGLSVTLLALAEAAGMNVDLAERVEIARVLAKPPEYFAQRNAAKNVLGFNTVNGDTP